MKNIFILSGLLLVFHPSVFAQKTWIGAGVGGAGTNFNTASNRSLSGVLTATDNVTIAIITSNPTNTYSV